jgi:hypothetical protein
MANQEKKREYMKEYHRKYQKTDKYKELKKHQKDKYLDQVKKDYRLKTAKHFYLLHKKSGVSVKNELEIFNMMEDAENTKEVKKIYDNLIKLIVFDR